MRIAFYGKGERHLGEIDILAGIATFAAIGVTIKLLFFDLQQACAHVPFLGMCPDADPWKVLLITFFSAASIASFVVAWWRAIRAFWIAIVVAAWQWISDEVAQIARKKMFDEVRSFPNTSFTQFDAEIKRAKLDEERLFRAQSLGVIKNKELWRHRWPEFDGKFKDHSEISVNSSEKRDRYQRSILQVRNCIENRNLAAAFEHVSIYVSSVQPAVLYCLKSVVEDCGSDFINIEDKMPTGPTNVEYAFSRYKESAEQLTTLFVAPLSAFLTYSGDSDGNLINTNFYPVSCLVKEKQDVLLAQGKLTNPVRKGTLFVYNNSTAEECLSRLPLEMIAPSGEFNVKFVDEFDAYKDLLKGKQNEHGDRIQKGDAIITWPPLTGYYRHREVNGAHFEFLQHSQMRENRESRIMLYGQSSLFDSPEKHELSWLLINALTHRFLLEDGSKWLGFKRGWFWSKTGKFLRDYKAKYRDIVT